MPKQRWEQRKSKITVSRLKKKMQELKWRTYHSCNSKDILKAKVLATILPKSHKGSRSDANDGTPKEKEGLNRQCLRLVHLGSIDCCCLKVNGKCMVLRWYYHLLELWFVTHKVRSKVGKGIGGRNNLPLDRKIGGNLSCYEARDQAIQPSKNTKDNPPAVPQLCPAYLDPHKRRDQQRLFDPSS